MENIQQRINRLEQRIKQLERKNKDDPNEDSELQAFVRSACRSSGMEHYFFRRTPMDYYNWELKERSIYLRCPIQCLCKSVILENKAWNGEVNDDENSQYYLVIVQYVSKLDTEKLRGLVRDLKSKDLQLSKKRFNFQLANEAESYELSGFSHNAVTPIGMKKRVPIILSKAIADLPEGGVYLGGGEIDLKLWVNINEFITAYKPFIMDCTFPRDL